MCASKRFVFLDRKIFSEMIRSFVFIFALSTQAKAAEPPLWVLLVLLPIWGRPSPIATRLGMLIFTSTKGFRPSRPQQLARQPYAARLRNMRVSHMQKETTAVFCASIFNHGQRSMKLNAGRYRTC